jgi:hypothetical protein
LTGLFHTRRSQRLPDGGMVDWLVLTEAGLESLFQDGWAQLQARLDAPQSWLVGDSRDGALNTPGVWEPHVVDVRRDDDLLKALLYVPPQLAWFAGHFPGRPLLPGVVQVDWAARLAAEGGWCGGTFAGLSQVKFTAPVLPATVLRLTLERRNGRLAFAMSSAAGSCTRGTLHYHV